MNPEDNPNVFNVTTVSQLPSINAVDGTMAFISDIAEIAIYDGTQWVAMAKTEGSTPDPKDIRHFVRETLTFAEREQMVIDFETFEKNGAIDDCTLREVVDRWKKQFGGTPVADFFGPARDLMFEIYRYHSEMVMDDSLM